MAPDGTVNGSEPGVVRPAAEGEDTAPAETTRASAALACLLSRQVSLGDRLKEGRIVTRHPARVLADSDELKARRCKSIRRIAYAVRCLWRRLSGQGRRGAPGRPGFGEDRKAPCRRPVNDRSGSGRAPKRASRAGTPALRRGVQMLCNYLTLFLVKISNTLRSSGLSQILRPPNGNITTTIPAMKNTIPI